MTIFTKTIGKNTVLCIPERFQVSEKTIKTYKCLVQIYRNLCEFYTSIISSLKKMEIIQKKLTDEQTSFKTRIEKFKRSVDDCRKKYVYAKWPQKDSERLHNEMSEDVSRLFKESNEIGHLWRQIKASRK
jgi:hypothetical protein